MDLEMSLKQREQLQSYYDLKENKPLVEQKPESSSITEITGYISQILKITKDST